MVVQLVVANPNYSPTTPTNYQPNTPVTAHSSSEPRSPNYADHSSSDPKSDTPN
jgi:hypothetical protein